MPFKNSDALLKLALLSNSSLSAQSNIQTDWSKLYRAISIVAANIVNKAYEFEQLSNPPNPFPSVQGLTNLNLIWTEEGNFSFSKFKAQNQKSLSTASQTNNSEGNTCFGFAASASDGSYNIVGLRGTYYDEEGIIDIADWSLTTDCYLPSQTTMFPNINQQKYGTVSTSLYYWYAVGSGSYEALAASSIQAIQAVEQANPGKPWLFAAHSLGGAMITLLALDVIASQVFGTTTPPIGVITFGSLHVGYQDFVSIYNENLPATFRFANLSDFVPGFVGSMPGTFGTNLYEHVGNQLTFTWQTWSDWDNHSLTGMYLNVLTDYWDVVKFGPVSFPQ